MSGSTRLVVRPSAWASVPPDPMGPLHRLMASNLLARCDARAVGAGSMALQARAADASVADAGGRSPGRRPSPTPRHGPGAETPSPGKHKGLSPATVGGDRAGAWPFHTETPHGRPPEKKALQPGHADSSGPRAFARSVGPPPGASAASATRRVKGQACRRGFGASRACLDDGEASARFPFSDRQACQDQSTCP